MCCHLTQNAQGSKVLMHGRNIYFGYVLDNSSKYSVSQKVFSKLTIISPRKTQDNSKINIQKFTQIRKSWAPLFSNQKGILILHNDQINSWIYIIKHQLLINKKTLLNIFGTFISKNMKRKFICMSLNYVLPSLMTLKITIF